jgi:hypothetical protein
MKMRLLSAAAVVAGTMMFAPVAANAAPQDFDLTNDTGYEISSVWIGAHGQPEWGDDIMGQDTLADGATVHIHFPGGRGETCDWDLQVSWTGYNEHPQWTDGFDLCTISKITLKWDKDTKVTSAVYE